jgi:hypothetical protein
MQTPSQMFIAVKLETTGNVLRKPFDVVKKFSIVVTPWKCVEKKIRNSNDQEIDKKLKIFFSWPDFPSQKKAKQIEEMKAILIVYL